MIFKDLDAEFPSFYSGMKITVQDAIAFKFWSTTFDVQEIDEIMFRDNRLIKNYRVIKKEGNKVDAYYTAKK